MELFQAVHLRFIGIAPNEFVIEREKQACFGEVGAELLVANEVFEDAGGVVSREPIAFRGGAVDRYEAVLAAINRGLGHSDVSRLARRHNYRYR